MKRLSFWYDEYGWVFFKENLANLAINNFILMIC